MRLINGDIYKKLYKFLFFKVDLNDIIIEIISTINYFKVMANYLMGTVS